MIDTTTTGPWVPEAGAESPWRTARTLGALSGLALVLLGLWGGLVPFVGPYLGFGFTPTAPWAYTPARLWLLILPARVPLGGALLATVEEIGLFTGLGVVIVGFAAVAAGRFSVRGPAVNRARRPV